MRIETPLPLRPLGTAEAERGSGARRWIAALFAGLVLAMAGVASAQVPRIGYVDMKRLLDNAPQMLAARESLQREFAARDLEYKTQETRLAELEEKFRRDAVILPKEVADARQFEIDTLRRSIERMRARMREELNARVQEENNKRWDEIHDVVVEYAREQKFEIVLQSPVIYASPTIDITDAVLERLKRGYTASASPPRP